MWEPLLGPRTRCPNARVLARPFGGERKAPAGRSKAHRRTLGGGGGDARCDTVAGRAGLVGDLGLVDVRAEPVARQGAPLAGLVRRVHRLLAGLLVPLEGGQEARGVVGIGEAFRLVRASLLAAGGSDLLGKVGLVAVHAEIVALEGAPLAGLVVGVLGLLARVLVSFQRDKEAGGVVGIGEAGLLLRALLSRTIAAGGSDLLGEIRLVAVHAEIVPLDGAPLAGLVLGVHGLLARVLVSFQRDKEAGGVARIGEGRGPHGFPGGGLPVAAGGSHLLRELGLVGVRTELVALKGAPLAGVAVDVHRGPAGRFVPLEGNGEAGGIVGVEDRAVYLPARGADRLGDPGLVGAHAERNPLEGAPLAGLAVRGAGLLAGCLVGGSRENARKVARVARVCGCLLCGDRSKPERGRHRAGIHRVVVVAVGGLRVHADSVPALALVVAPSAPGGGASGLLSVLLAALPVAVGKLVVVVGDGVVSFRGLVVVRGGCVVVVVVVVVVILVVALQRRKHLFHLGGNRFVHAGTVATQRTPNAGRSVLGSRGIALALGGCWDGIE
ncbi:unnamed protein product [Pseudo-nitzschia multistriata]|uniref:Uncharacterized protein n=1 Tax=Pseudo-nitzschia multistriata TaxID=183589 RepID=A0A448ZEJ5_9STRA|nr:unnamed protein product [Pseudo-nitzschia multistriata]